MHPRLLTHDHLPVFLKELAARFEVHAPLPDSGVPGRVAWGRLPEEPECVEGAGAIAPAWVFTNTELSPKGYFLPQSQGMFRFGCCAGQGSSGGGGVTEEAGRVASGDTPASPATGSATGSAGTPAGGQDIPADGPGPCALAKPGAGIGGAPCVMSPLVPAPEREGAPYMLLNVRPCDARAFAMLDGVFRRGATDGDPLWAGRRESTVLVGLACNHPCPTCFCTSADTGPHGPVELYAPDAAVREAGMRACGMDVLLVPLDRCTAFAGARSMSSADCHGAMPATDMWLVRAFTDKGAELVSALPEASEGDIARAEILRAGAEAQLVPVARDKAASAPLTHLFDAPFWEDVAATCLNCGVCTFVCPTCHCFDIQDESHAMQGLEGRRVRVWDHCMSAFFTVHTSGHNPRGSRVARVRQRFMHKFRYMPEKLGGDVGCVGCGRCSRLCPVNIDVRDVVTRMQRRAGEKVHA